MISNNIPVITRWTDADALAGAVAHFIVLESRKAINIKNFFTLALSGGSTPKLLYALLATEPFKSNIDWKKVIIVFGDERFVPQTSDESNYKMAMDALLSKISIPKKNILDVPVKKLTPAASAKQYEQKIKSFINSKTPCDLVLLGIGEDGHTASIFPDSELINDTKKLVRNVWVEEKKMDRISFTLPFINKAKNIAFLASGESKASIVKSIFSAKGKELPAAQVKASQQLYWFLDDEAASLV